MGPQTAPAFVSTRPQIPRRSAQLARALMTLPSVRRPARNHAALARALSAPSNQ